MAENSYLISSRATSATPQPITRTLLMLEGPHTSPELG